MALEDIESEKQKMKVALLLDERDHLYIRGEDRTCSLERKPVVYGLLRFLLERRGSASLGDVFEMRYRITKDKALPPSIDKTRLGRTQCRSIRRTIRHLNAELRKSGLDRKAFFVVGVRRVVLNRDVAAAVIRRGA